MQYDTRLSYRQPITPDMQAEALAAMRDNVPRAYGQNAADVYRAHAGSNAADYKRAADLANMSYNTDQQNAQRKLALSGLQQMADAHQAESQYQTSLASSLLGGLFR